MLLIRGGVEGPLRTQMVYSCLDAVEAVVKQAAQTGGKFCSGPKWPAGLILGEEAQSKVIRKPDSGAQSGNARKEARRPRAVRAEERSASRA